MKFLLNILFIGLILSSAFSQTSKRDYKDELRDQNKAINSLNDEIQRLRGKIDKAESQERSAVKKILNLDEEISLTEKLIKALKREEENTRGRISRLKENIQKNEDELQFLRERYELRIVNTYQKGQLTDLEKVLSSTTWRQAMYRTHYLKIISEIEQNMTKKIEKLLIAISQQKLEMEVTLRNNLNLKREKEKNIKSYRKLRISREKELNKIRSNKKSLTNYIDEKEAGIQQLESIIKKVLEDKARFEREERIRQQQQALKTKSFKSLKGNLPWPAQGRIIAKFGRQWNPKHKTTTDNPGIDIKGQPGSEIKSIMNGVVTTITYLRGYGTTIIVDNGGGFYTVFSHVTNIQTHVDSEIRAGDVIAYMGDSGSINGAKLHFEIWGKGQKLDPEKWLMKN
jgi:septal ring factor EnvC (AmiA/AmiB activator)|tara:strand:- start:535 stop:1731 length:1197 start_codon:yes stop_codon:yes gene_type:complete